MYTPDNFKNTNRKELIEFVQQNGFGILITIANANSYATHIPMQINYEDDNLFLVGHISKENNQAETFFNNSNAMAIFNGPHAYVSSSWYSIENVSTWNYIAVHASGTLTILSEIELYESLIKLTNHYEQGSENPKYFENIDTKVIRDNISGIVGFKIKVESLVANYKLSQNRSDKDYKNIVDHLKIKNDAQSAAVADEMCKRRKI